MIREEAPEALKEAISWEDSFNVILAIIDVAGKKQDPKQLLKYEVLAIHTNLLDSEVYNGGFHQFFRNKSGDYALKILDSLREIGSYHITALLETAISVFPSIYVFEEENKRFEFMQKMEEKDLRKWRELSQAYYQSPESIYDMVISYTRTIYDL